MLISVIIPTLNSAKTIAETLGLIFANDFPKELFEVIVVDNGSTDATEEAAKNFPVIFLKCSKRGQGPARNLGLKNAKGKIICFTDSDILIPKDWLSRMFRFFQENPNADGVGGIVLPPQEENHNSIRRIAGEIYVERQGFPKKITRTRYLKGQGTLYTANSAYRKEALLTCKGFDEPMWHHYYYHDSCDIDLSWKLVKMGKKLLFDPNVRVYHYAHSNLSNIRRQLYGWGAAYTMVRKKHNWRGSLRERIWPLQYVADSCFSIALAPFSSTHGRRKRLLRIFYVSSFSLGRLAGFKRWKKERITDIRARQRTEKEATS